MEFWSGDTSTNQMRQEGAAGDHLVQTSAQSRFLKATSSQVLSICKNEDSTASLGSL